MLKMTLKFLKTLGRTLVLLWSSSRINFMVTVLISLFTGIFLPLEIFIWKNVVDEIANLLNRSTDSQIDLYIWLSLYFFINIIKRFLSSFQQYTQLIFSGYLDKNIKNHILTKAINFDLKDFDNPDIYNEFSKASQESSSRSFGILQTLLQTIQNMASLIGTFALLALFETRIILLCLISTIPIFYVSCKVMNKLFEIFNKRFENLRYADNLEKLLIKNENMKELKVYKIGSYLKQFIIDIHERNLKEDKKIRRNIMFQNIGVNIIDVILEYIIKLLTIILSIQKALTIGSVTMYISSIDTLKLSVQNILALVSNLCENSLYMSSIFEIMDRDCYQNGMLKFTGSLETIEFRNVSFKYPGSENYVLEHINLTFQGNQTYALVGYNGAGKSTLIKLMLDLYQPTDGEILLNGIKMSEYDRDSIFDFTSAVFQDFIKYPFNIKDNIGIGNISQMDQMDRIKEAAQKAGIAEYISRLPEQYETKLQKEWTGSTDLSLGQWQKIAIARALMHDSHILILDEPTSSLDALSEYEIFNHFKNLKDHKLCVLVTHRLSNITLADNIIVLDHCKVIESGTHEELVKQKGLYNKLYQLQSEMYIKNSMN